LNNNFGQSGFVCVHIEKGQSGGIAIPQKSRRLLLPNWACFPFAMHMGLHPPDNINHHHHEMEWKYGVSRH
jgi:hypothetical protein